MTLDFDLERVLFVIPAYNEENNLREVVTRLLEIIPEARVLVVDDGSVDGTYRTARKSGAMVARLPFNLGIGVAVQTGIIFAWDHGFDWVIRLDGDGQHDPSDVARFLEYVRTHDVDLLIGSRFMEKSGYQLSLLRRMAISFFNRLISLLTGFHITDATSGFQAYSRSAMEKLRRLFPDDYPEPETIIMLYKWGLKVDEIPVVMKQRPEGASSITTIRSVYYMVKVTMAILLDMIRY